MSTSIVPIPKVPIHIRTGTIDDLAFMDALHKKHSGALGYWPTRQFEEYIAAGHVLIAEQVMSDECGVMNKETLSTHHSSLITSPLGYLISKDRYLKRDELGVIYQLCIVPSAQRGLIGASLVKAAFERSAYGCRLYCCWCAQDLEANYFWESLGFVPIAFRSGSDKKKRIHIFWQKKIYPEDTDTKWWYPFQTAGGALQAERMVWPIVEGVHWRDVKAPVLSRVEGIEVARASRPRLPVKKNAGETPAPRNGPGPGKVGILVGGRIKYVDRPGWTAPLESKPSKKQPAQKPPAPKLDAKFLTAARELRDRRLEYLNSEQSLIESSGKYEVFRQIEATGEPKPPMLLEAA